MKALLPILRTVIVILGLGVVMLACLIVCAVKGLGPEYMAHVGHAVVGLGIAAAGKSSLEVLGKGQGLWQSVKNVVTQSKPPEGT